MHSLKYLALVSWLSASVGWSGTIDEFSRSVVFLSQNVPVIEEINGIRFEVWLKFPATNAFIPKPKRISGSGFVVVSSNLAYLVTARHVATNMTEDCEVAMQGDKKEPLRFKLSSITGQPAIRWFHHTNADVSVYPLPTITSEGVVALNRRAIPLEFLEPQTNLPSRDTYLTALGFPLGLGAEGEFIPLSRDSKVSSGMLNDGGSLFFLLQDPSVSGYSGGPLIQSGDPRVIATDRTAASISVVSGGARCWGFVSGTFADETGGKMSRITPSFYAVELIHKAQRELRIWPANAPSSEKR
jgi:S1-C subfamily serine protease